MSPERREIWEYRPLFVVTSATNSVVPRKVTRNILAQGATLCSERSECLGNGPVGHHAAGAHSTHLPGLPGALAPISTAEPGPAAPQASGRDSGLAPPGSGGVISMGKGVR
jgi:hypothetical protein